MNPAILFLLLTQTNGGRGLYSTVSSIDEPDHYDADESESNGAFVAVMAVLISLLIFMVVVLYEVLVVGNKSWPA
jgi:uncharacterized membrane-anchored protein